MVFSKVSNIEYVETDKINDGDKEMECNTYDILFENIDTKYHLTYLIFNYGPHHYILPCHHIFAYK